MLRNRPLPTEIIDNPSDFRPEPGSTYVYGVSIEERSEHVQIWRGQTTGVEFISLSALTRSEFHFGPEDAPKLIHLRAKDELNRFWADRSCSPAYLDLTGLPHHIWAPLLRAALDRGTSVRVVYAEPRDYRFHASPTPAEVFDLSERIEGIEPLPGFASLTEDRNESSFVFVPLLGFEGPRFSYMLEQVQPSGDKVVPVVGVPGFRPEYPFHSYYGNRLPLQRSGAWKHTRYAIANCPFSLFYVLKDIARDYAGDRLKVALIGTKPHALGAVMFAISSPGLVELVYDHPIRKARRTSGSERLLIFHVSNFYGT